MIFVLFGADALGIRRRLQQLKDEADGGTGMLTTNLSAIDGRDAKPEDIIGPAMMPPFLAPKRLILVEGLIDRFEQRGEQRQPRSIDSLAPLFAAFEAGLPESSTVVLTGGPVRRNALADRLRRTRNVAVEEFAELKGENLIRYIRDEAGARGIRFRAGGSRLPAGGTEDRPRETDPAALLAALLQSDTLSIANELDKLALYSMGRDVTVDDVALVSAGERAFTAFEFADGVIDGDLGRAFSALTFLREQGQSTQGLLGLLVDGYRATATVLDMLEDGASAEEIGRAIRRPWPRLRDRAIARARRLGVAGLRAAYAAIVEADRASKSGEVDEDMAFDLLVTRLGSLTAPAAGRR